MYWLGTHLTHPLPFSRTGLVRRDNTHLRQRRYSGLMQHTLCVQCDHCTRQPSLNSPSKTQFLQCVCDRLQKSENRYVLSAYYIVYTEIWSTLESGGHWLNLYVISLPDVCCEDWSWSKLSCLGYICQWHDDEVVNTGCGDIGAQKSDIYVFSTYSLASFTIVISVLSYSN